MHAQQFSLEDFLPSSQLQFLSNLLDQDPDNFQFLQQEVHKYGSRFQDLRRGDIISLYRDWYQNNGVGIWNGTSLVDLAYDTEINEYGYVPSEFLVITEFPILHWSQIIVHNSLVPFNQAMFMTQMVDSFKPYIGWSGQEPSLNGLAVATFEYNQQDHQVFISLTTPKSITWQEARKAWIQWMQSYPIAHYSTVRDDSETYKGLKATVDFEFVEGQDLYMDLNLGSNWEMGIAAVLENGQRLQS